MEEVAVLQADVSEQTESLMPQALRAAWQRREALTWVAVLAVVITVQWPTMKGLYDRTTDAPAPTSSIVWRRDSDGALAEARAAKKRVLVDFSASWCPSCVTMRHDVWPDAGVARVIDAGYVAVKVDVDMDTDLSPRYQVESIPTVLLLDAAGRVVKRNDGFLPRSGVLRFLAESTH